MGAYDISKNQYKLLKYLNRKPRTVGSIKIRFLINNDELSELLRVCSPYISYLGRNFSNSTVISIKNSGTVLVEQRFRLDFRARIPMILSIAALFLSALSIVLSPFLNSFFTWLYGL